MTADRLRSLGKLEFRDPTQFLEQLRLLEYAIGRSEIDPRVRSLRTNLLKSERELRDAAIFCHGMSAIQGVDIGLSAVEDQDFDFVASWVRGEYQHVCPIQLKELVPQNLNPQASLESLLQTISTRYPDSADVTFAIKLNQPGRFDPTDVELPDGLHLGGLWMFAAASEDQNEWIMWGDFMQPGPTLGACFSYPKPIGLVF